MLALVVGPAGTESARRGKRRGKAIAELVYYRRSRFIRDHRGKQRFRNKILFFGTAASSGFCLYSL